jgi:hypothetical protein
MSLTEACNFVLITKVTSNKIYSYFHLATDDKDIISVIKVSMYPFTMNVVLTVAGVLTPSCPSCLVVLVVDRR